MEKTNNFLNNQRYVISDKKKWNIIFYIRTKKYKNNLFSIIDIQTSITAYLLFQLTLLIIFAWIDKIFLFFFGIKISFLKNWIYFIPFISIILIFLYYFFETKFYYWIPRNLIINFPIPKNFKSIIDIQDNLLKNTYYEIDKKYVIKNIKYQIIKK